MIRVAALDTAPIFCEALAEYVRHSPDLTQFRATNRVRTAMSLCDQGELDVLIIDSLLDPDSDLVRYVRLSGQPVAFLSLVRPSASSGQYVRTALISGVNGLIRRDAAPEQLWSAVRGVGRGQSCLDPKLAAVPGLPAQRTQRMEPAPLSQRELEVLRGIARGRSTAMIAEELGISAETVRSHVKRVFQRLGVRDRTQAVVEGFRRGVLASPAGGG